VKLPLAQDVGHRLAALAAPHQGLDGVGLGFGQGISIMGDEPGALDAEGVGHEDLRFQPGFAALQVQGGGEAIGQGG
jgi:hypothetical protein